MQRPLQPADQLRVVVPVVIELAGAISGAAAFQPTTGAALAG